MILAARFVVPGDGPPIENGAIRIDGGRILAVGTRREVSPSTGEAVIDYEDAALLPGMVNAHTHLELSHLAGRLPPDSFVPWLTRVAETLTREPPTQQQAAAACRTGIVQSIAAGVTTVGDITRAPGWTRPVVAESPIRCVSFGEVIAIGRGRGALAARLAAAASTELQTDRLRIGLSPHAPYSVEPAGLRACAAAAARGGLPVAVHVAESAEEAEFTRNGSGLLARFLQEVGLWDDRIPVAGLPPIAVVDRAGLLSPRTVLAHGNFVDDEDISRIARSGASVAYCPRTHAAFGHPPHRFRDMLAAGVNVCIGTDSLASNPSLSILDELRFLHRSGCGLSAELLLRMATVHGADALGLLAGVGSIARGKHADVCVVPVDAATSAGVTQAVLRSGDPPAAIYIGGECVQDRSAAS